MADDDDFTLYEPVLGILSGGGRERHSPARPGVLYGRVALGSAGKGQAATLQHAVLLVPGRKPGRTCAKIVHFNPGSGVRALQPFSTQCSWFRAANRAGPEPKLFFLLIQVIGQTAAMALQQAFLLVPGC
jgi:hypothetical protein